MLIGINTFAIPGLGGTPSAGRGGLVLDEYRGWIDSVTQPVPEPSAVWLWAVGLLGLGVLTRGRRE